MTNVDELKRALDFPWEKWTVLLNPEQRERLRTKTLTVPLQPQIGKVAGQVYNIERSIGTFLGEMAESGASLASMVLRELLQNADIHSRPQLLLQVRLVKVNKGNMFGSDADRNHSGV